MTRFITPTLVLTAILMLTEASPSIGQSSASISKLPFKSKVTTSGTGASSNLVAADRARVDHIKSQAGNKDAFGHNHVHARAKHTFGITNTGRAYTASVHAGGKWRDLLIDTGSSNTWIGLTELVASDYNTPWTSPKCNESLAWGVPYGSGLTAGFLCYDEVRLSDDLVIHNQTFGSIDFVIGYFDGIDGILGIGPLDLTKGTVENYMDNRTIPTITDNLLTQGTIKTESIGIYFAPTEDSLVTNGELTFGDVDSSKLSGHIRYTPLTKTTPASNYWGVNQTASYGHQQILPSSAGIMDTGTTLLYLATEAYDQYVNATGAVLDESVSLLTITEEQYKALKPLTFDMGSAGTHTLSPNAQIWPRALNSLLGGNDSAIYLITQDLGSPLGQGLDFINGYTFLERFYTVYDTTHSRFGIAPTAFTYATTN